jgi:hypothetical protein
MDVLEPQEILNSNETDNNSSSQELVAFSCSSGKFWVAAPAPVMKHGLN